MSWQQTIEQTVVGLGFDLVEITRSAGGLLCVTIDCPYVAGQSEQFVTVEDCEGITRQLQYLLEVEQVDYKRLEVGSPGIDRPLRHAADFTRFIGQLIDVTLKEAIGQTGSGVAVNRKKFRGTLEAGSLEGHWQIVWRDEPNLKPGQRISKKRVAAPLQAMQFNLDEIREARLAPVVNFKGRTPRTLEQAAPPVAAAPDLTSDI